MRSQRHVGAPLLLSLVVLLAVRARAAEQEAPATGAPRADWAGECTRYGDPVQTGAVPPPLEELSGFAASRRHPGIYWAHNDSGNAFELFALRMDGTIVARFPLRGAKSRDVEDIAVGPCAPGAKDSCIYLGDIGDNRARHADARIYRLPEPEALDGRPLQVVTSRFRFADGPRNAEALLVEPKSARLFVISKELGSLGGVYRLDKLTSPSGGTAMRIAEIPAPHPLAGLTTSGDIHPSGDRLILRTYGSAWELRAPGATRLEDVLRAEPASVPSGRQRQAEAVAYAADGRGYVLGGEGAGSPLYEVRCLSERE